MDHKLRIARSVLVSLFFMGILFAALALLPTWAQGPEEHERKAADEPPPLGDVSAQLLVSSTTGYLIDDGTAGYTESVAPDGWLPWVIGAAYNGACRYTDVTLGTAGDYAEWKPDLATGPYEVLVHFVQNANHRTDAEYVISHADGVDHVRISQQGAGPAGVWRSLGVYNWNAGGVNNVRLTDSKAPWGAGTFVVADAVHFAPMDVWVDTSFSSVNSGPYLWGVDAFNTIQDGIDAVANGGTVHVLPGTHYQSQPLLVTKGITLTGAGPATTAISTTDSGANDMAIAMLASNVRITGLTIGGAPGVDYGIINYTPPGGPWVTGLSGYVISNNVIEGFYRGIWLYQSAGDIISNTVRNNRDVGIYVQEFPTVVGAPTTISGNALYSNGTGLTDYDIWVHDSFTGTMVSNNTVTGSLGGNEACILVYNTAWNLTLSANAVTSCTGGVFIFGSTGTNIPQKVNLYGNTITGGTKGVLMSLAGGTTTAGPVTIGGSAAHSNSIFGNSGKELELQGYVAATDVPAEYNDWGVCTIRQIEDEINHFPDPGFGPGAVDYEPALCVPFTIDLETNRTSMPADGLSTATITATVRDAAGNRAKPGTMIGITSSLGSVVFGFAEAEGPAGVVTRTGAWTAVPFARASNGVVERALAPAASVSWSFRGRAVSLIYMKRPASGLADVYIDGGFVRTINTASPLVDEFRVEDVITTTLNPAITHTIEVRPQGPNNIFVDAFRSGGVVVSGGRVVTTFTAGTIPGVAQVWGTVYDGHIITPTSTVLYPIVTDTVMITLQAADLYVTKTASPTSLNSGQRVTYTITYGNIGPETATNTIVTDTLPANFLYVSANPTPIGIAGGQVTWSVGNLTAGMTGTLTVVARPDQSVLWCTPAIRTNGAEIASDVPDPILGNNSTGAVNVTVVVPAGVTISAHPPSIPVSNGNVTTTLRITVTDSNANLVHNVPVLLTTTVGTFPASGGTSVTVTTTQGVATAALASNTTVTTATVTATVMPACLGMPWTTIHVPFVAALPYSATTVADPTLIRICGDTSVITATVYDSFGNLVENGTEVQFVVVPGVRGYMDPEWGETLNGVVSSTLHTLGYKFGEQFLTVKIQARRGTQQELAQQRVDLRPGLPYNIALTPTPAVISVDGNESTIRAMVTDCGGNAVEDGTTVTFTVSGLGTITPTVTTTMGGMAFATFKSGCTLGDVIVTAVSDSRTFTTHIELEPGPADHFGSLALTRDTIRNCGDTAEISALVYDRCLNLVKDNTQVTFGVAFDMVKVTPNPALTRNGKVVATVTSLSKPLTSWPKTHEQIGLASGSALPDYKDLWIEPGDPSEVLLTADPDSIPINGAVNFYDIIVEAEILDCSGTPVTDTTQVTLETSRGLFRESGTWGLTRLTADGIITATLTSEERAGPVVVTATVDSILDTVDVYFLPDEPYHVDVWGHPFSITANGYSTSQITALIQDYYYNPVLDGITVTFVTDHGHWFESGTEFYTTTTTTDGYAFARLVSSTDYVGTVNIYAITYNGRIGPGIVQFTVPHYTYLPVIKRLSP